MIYGKSYFRDVTFVDTTALAVWILPVSADVTAKYLNQLLFPRLKAYVRNNYDVSFAHGVDEPFKENDTGLNCNYAAFGFVQGASDMRQVI